MPTREAACHCGQLRLGVMGDPFVVSICHCLACQWRTGSAVGMQAAFRADPVHVAGRFNDYTRISDEADSEPHAFHFCPDCGSQVFYTEPDEPDLIVVFVGSLAAPAFSAADRVGIHLPPSSLADPAGVARGPRLRAVGARATALRGRRLRRGGGRGTQATRRPSRAGSPLLQRRLLREPRRQAPTPSRTLRARSRSGTAAEGSPVTTPTSIRSDRSSLLRGSSTASPSGIAADRR